MSKQAILVGGFHEIIELCEDCGVEIVGIIDNELENEYLNYSVIGRDKDANKIYREYPNVPLIITPDLPVIRKKLAQQYSSIGFSFRTLISQKARISKSASIGQGTIIQSGVHVSSFCQIGDFVKLNVNANVMHDTTIENFVTIAPNALLLGRVNVEEMCYIGANATILPNITIKGNSIVGAGAVVTKNILNSETVVGVPAKIIKK